MDVFDALADPVRRRLLHRLADGPARVVDLARAHAISRPAISRHLRVLLQAGVIAVEDRGRERHYRLHLDGLGELRRFLAVLDGAVPQPAVRFGPETLDGLELEVRRTRRDPDRRSAPDARPTRKDSA